MIKYATDSAISIFITSQFGFIGYLIIYFLLLSLHFMINIIRFSLYMKTIGLKSTFPIIMIPVSIFYIIRNNMLVGAMWFTKQTHSIVIIVSISILLLSLVRAFYNANALEFARGAALIVIAGLFSIIAGLREATEIKRMWRTFVAPKNVPATTDAGDAINNLKELLDDPVDKANWRAQWIAVIVTAFGTFLWAYGDQILACGVFPMLKIADKSGVACFASNNQPCQSGPIPEKAPLPE